VQLPFTSVVVLWLDSFLQFMCTCFLPSHFIPPWLPLSLTAPPPHSPNTTSNGNDKHIILFFGATSLT